MLDVDTAMNTVISQVKPLDSQWVHINCGSGRRIKKNVFSSLSLPPFKASVVDGYALRSGQSDIRKIVASEQLVNNPETEAIILGTGNKVPDCFDAVIPVEYTFETEVG